MNKIKKILKPNLWCIHGNLQLPSVWSDLEENFSDQFNIHKVNLWKSNGKSLWEWSKLFCREVTVQSKCEDNFLLGYSLGGRLALHSLISKPNIWKKAVIIGTDTGYGNQKERYRQLVFDKSWSDRFLVEPWDELLKNWNSQSVFCGYDNKFVCKEKDFDRKTISRFFNIFSKGRQEDLITFLSGIINKPILYIQVRKIKNIVKLGKT